MGFDSGWRREIRSNNNTFGQKIMLPNQVGVMFNVQTILNLCCIVEHYSVVTQFLSSYSSLFSFSVKLFIIILLL